MQYYKIVYNGLLSGINTINADGNGNITKEEYDSIKELLVNIPTGKQIRDNGDGTYSYEDAPPMPEPEPTDEDYAAAGRILMGVES